MITTTPEEYNVIYREKPTKWANEARDTFTFHNLNQYYKRAPKNILDIGCGNGHLLKLIGSQWPHAELWGLDFSTEAIRIARLNVPKGRFICADLLFNMAPSFDLVICAGVLEHFTDIEGAMIEIAKHMDDVLYLEVPNCLAYSLGREEGWRLTTGGKQHEWHLRRETWEKYIDTVFTIKKSIIGPYPHYEFVWILK